jgi:hypothetical protein
MHALLTITRGPRRSKISSSRQSAINSQRTNHRARFFPSLENISSQSIFPPMLVEDYTPACNRAETRHAGAASLVEECSERRKPRTVRTTLLNNSRGEIHMKSQSKALALGVAAAVASILSPATALATGSCYAFTPAYANGISTIDGGPPLVLRYIPVNVGSINTDTEARTLSHLKQQAYSLVGKATVLFDDRCATTGPADCVEPVNNLPQIRLMTTVDGTIITGKVLLGTYPVDAPGAHMGIDVQFLRRIPYVEEFAIGPLTLECTSPQSSPTPAYWLCNVRAEIDIGYFPFFQQFAFNVPVRLEKLPANTAPACSVFEDGRLEVPDA